MSNDYCDHFYHWLYAQKSVFLTIFAFDPILSGDYLDIYQVCKFIKLDESAVSMDQVEILIIYYRRMSVKETS